jgi:hypothetical protein
MVMVSGKSQKVIRHLVISFGATKPPAHPDDGDGISSQNTRKPSIVM